MYIVGIYKIYI